MDYKRGARSYVRTRLLAAVLIGFPIALTGCSSSTDQPPASAQQLASTAQTALQAAAPTSSTPTATVAPPKSASATAAKPDFPPAVTRLEHGGTYWGVYVVVVRTGQAQQITPEDQKRLDTARKSLTDIGYKPDSGAFDVGCEQGLVETLRLDPQRQYAATRIFFKTETQAQQFVKAYQPGVVGTAKVTLYCMD